MIYSLKYFYFLEEAKRHGLRKKVHHFAREYGIHILMISIMIVITESIIIESPDAFKFNTA